MSKELLHFNIGGADVYVAEFDEAVEVQPVQPVARQQVIEQCGDELHKRQRYCVWRLLDYALKQRCGLGVDELDFTVDGNGKWSCNGGVHFSLSHCEHVVAVAVSESPVGIDVEAVSKQRFNARLSERILTAREQTLYNSLPPARRPRALAEMWTVKESLFKRDGGKIFAPASIDSTARQTQCQTLVIGKSNQYVIAVAN